MKKIIYLLAGISFVTLSGQIGISTQNPQATLHVDGAKDNPLTGSPSTAQGLNDFVVTNTGSVGIGTIAPTQKLEISSGTTDVSGLKFTSVNNMTASTVGAAPLGVDANGNVVVTVAPLFTYFKAFTVDANTPVNSLLQVGGLEFRYNGTTCGDVATNVEARTLGATNNIGIQHDQRYTSQNYSALQNTVSRTIMSTFSTVATVNCYQDGHYAFTFFSYTDKKFYRVGVHAADGDNLQSAVAQGYIFVEFQQ